MKTEKQIERRIKLAFQAERQLLNHGRPRHFMFRYGQLQGAITALRWVLGGYDGSWPRQLTAGGVAREAKKDQP